MFTLPRFRNLPVGSLAVVLGSLLVGLTLVPAAAQRAGLTEGAVTVRSDGAVYLISGGQRHWVATVVISDEELNGYPEAEPIYFGLAPFGSAGSTSSAKPSGTASAGSGSSGSGSGSGSASATATPVPGAMVKPNGKECPASHTVKGGFDKYYWEPDRPDYLNVEPEVCFISGGDARAAGYKNTKNR